MKATTTTTALVALLLTAGAARADDRDPSLEVRDRGDAVEVIAHNVRSSRTALNPVRQRLEIAVAGMPHARRALPTDATIKQVEFDGDDTRVLSVKLGFDRAEVKDLAPFARVEQLGADLHVMIPRAVPAAGKAPLLPDWTRPAPTPPAAGTGPMLGPSKPPGLDKPVAVAAPAAPIGPAAPVAPPAAAITAPAPAATAPTAATSTTATATPAPTTPAAPAAPATLRAATASPDDALSRTSLLAALGLAILGGGTWLFKKRRGVIPNASTIDVLAQRSLGNKAKVVWLSAGGREMVVAVTPQQVRMLGQWRRPGEVGALPEATALEARGTGRTPTVSPAVSGILKLRERSALPTINEEIATDDIEADALWAKEILAASGGRR
jgi:flagellar biogenesis protein FliO